MVKASAADGLEVSDVPLKPGEGVGFDLESKPSSVAEGAEDAGGVVLEGALVEDADEARVEVGEAAGRVEDFAALGAVEAEGEGVDGEVAAAQILADGGGFDGREGTGAGVSLGAGGDEV